MEGEILRWKSAAEALQLDLDGVTETNQRLTDELEECREEAKHLLRRGGTLPAGESLLHFMVSISLEHPRAYIVPDEL